MKKALLTLFMLTSLLILSGCSPIKYVNTDFNTNGKIAVLICETKLTKENAMFAGYFSDGLARGSKLRVISQNQVKSMLGSYPERIKGPYRIKGTEFEVDYSLHDLDALAAVAKKLNVQYLYAIWIPHSIELIQAGNRMPVYEYVAELIEFPSQRIMVQTKYQMTYAKDGSGMIVVGGSAPRNEKDMCKFYSEILVADLIKNTGIGK